MKYLIIKVVGEQISSINKYQFPKGSVNVFGCNFQFSGGWDGINKSAVFRVGNKTTPPILLDENNQVTIPHECFLNHDVDVFAGIYGTVGSEIVRPTVWTKIGSVVQGAEPGDTIYPDPTNWYGEVVDLASRAFETAQSVRDDADSGEFDGSNYTLTEKDKDEIATLAYDKITLTQDLSRDITTFFPDKITFVIRSYAIWGNIAQFTIQFDTKETVQVGYGAAIFQLPHKAIARVWLNNGTEYFIEGGYGTIKRNGPTVPSGNKMLSGMYIIKDDDSTAGL